MKTTPQLWYVSCERKPVGRERKGRLWSYVTLARSAEKAIANVREDARWWAVEEQDGPGVWHAEPYGSRTAALNMGRKT
jgi:hypothetical protein